MDPKDFARMGQIMDQMSAKARDSGGVVQVSGKDLVFLASMAVIGAYGSLWMLTPADCDEDEAFDAFFDALTAAMEAMCPPETPEPDQVEALIRVAAVTIAIIDDRYSGSVLSYAEPHK